MTTNLTSLRQFAVELSEQGNVNATDMYAHGMALCQVRLEMPDPVPGVPTMQRWEMNDPDAGDTWHTLDSWEYGVDPGVSVADCKALFDYYVLTTLGTARFSSWPTGISDTRFDLYIIDPDWMAA